MQFSMKAIGVPLVLFGLFYLSFSVYSHHQNLLLSVYHFLVTSNSKLGRFAFVAVFTFIIVIISLGRSKTSEADFEGFFSQISLLFESISNTTTIDMDDKFQCSNNVDDNEHQVYDGSDEDINSDDIGGEEDDDDDDENDTDNEHQGYDGSEEDNDEDINSDDIGKEEADDDDENDTDNETEKRAEEFIAEVKQKWGEELLTDRLLCITSA